MAELINHIRGRIFASAYLAVGVWSDQAAGVLGRIGSWVLGVTLLSTVAFLVLPWVAPRGSPGLFVAITALWAATSAALRAPPLTLLGRYVAKPAVPWLVSLVLLGTGTASAIGPYQGLPLKGWSRSGGDLRVAHFFALHIRQALPLAGWLIVASGVRRPMLAVHLAAAALLGLVAFVFVQALAGQPFIV